VTGGRQVRSYRCLANLDHDINWTKLIAQLAEYFSNGTLHQGTGNRARRGMPADHDSEAGFPAYHIISSA
jgi:hypothetical protein